MDWFSQFGITEAAIRQILNEALAAGADDADNGSHSALAAAVLTALGIGALSRGGRLREDPSGQAGREDKSERCDRLTNVLLHGTPVSRAASRPG